jgi:hypothetical protein
VSRENPDPRDRSALLNNTIRTYVQGPHIRDISFRSGIFLCSSSFEDSVAIAGTASFLHGYLLVDDDGRVPGFFFGNPQVQHAWAWVGGHSDSSLVNVIMDRATIAKSDISAFRDQVRPVLREKMKRPDHSEYSLWDGTVDGFGRIIAINSGYGTGGVDAYRSAAGLYLDYESVDLDSPDNEGWEEEDDDDDES